MKKYIPARMIRQSRFRTFYETWGVNEKELLIARMNRLIDENQEYADANNYGHLCNLLTSIAMIMVLEENGKTREEAEKEVAEAMYEYKNLRSYQ